MSKRPSSKPLAEVGFAIESWEKGTLGDETRGWERMDDDDRAGVAKVWRPRATAREAITKACTWTGWMFIPAMQVRELVSGKVIWRKGESNYPECGPDIDHPDEPIPDWRRIDSEPPPRSSPAGGFGTKAPERDQLSLDV